VRRSGTRIRVEYLDVRAMLTTRPHARVGFVVPKYGHSSVDRNRLKRRLRELVRTQLLPSLRLAAQADHTAVADGRAAMQGDADGAGLPPVDVVVRALPGAYDAPFAALAAEVGRVYDGVRARVTHAGR
jgi:RNase P protein component